MNTIRGLFRGLWSLVLQNPVYAQALVQASIALLTAFGLNWNGVQIGATMAFSAALLAFITQKAVTPLENPVIPSGTVVTVTTPEDQPDSVVTV